MREKGGVVISAPSLFEIARKAAKGQDGLTAIVFAAASLEGLINEVTELAAVEIGAGTKDDVLEGFSEALAEAEQCRVSTELKYILASIVLTGKPYRRGAQPYQDFALLMKLRNAIMHFRPTVLMFDAGTGSSLAEAGDVIKKLQDRKLIEPIRPNVAASLLWEGSKPAVTKWAVNAAATMAQSFMRSFRTGGGPTYLTIIQAHL